MTKHALLAAAVLAAVALPAAAAPPRAEVIGVPRAVGITEAAVKGKVLEVELDYEKGRLVYELKAVSGNRLHDVLVDANTAEIVSEKPRRLEGFWRSWFNADRLAAVRAAPVSLADLLAKVEADTKVRVREVGIGKERGQTFYEVELADAGRHVLIDPRTGAIREGRIDD